MTGVKRGFDYAEARAIRAAGVLTYQQIADRLGTTAEAVRYACRGALINNTPTSAAKIARRKRQEAGVADKVSLRKFAALTADDPAIPADGSCAVCGRPRQTERSTNYAQGCAEIDAFCSSTCARKHHGTSLPESQRADMSRVPICGTTTAYHRGCRCDRCTRAVRVAKAESRDRLRKGAVE